MHYSKRTLVILAGLSVLATSATAQTFTFGNQQSWETVTAPGEINIADPTLNAGFSGLSDPNSPYTSPNPALTVTSDKVIKLVDVNQVNGLVFNSTLTFSIQVDGITAFTQTVVDDATTDPLGTGIGFNPSGKISGVTLAANVAHTITYTAVYTGTSNPLGAGAFMNDFYVSFDAVPEPAPFAAFGVGLIGLLARRRKGSK